MQTGSDGFPIRTATMAKIFVQQGHYDKAIEIYRHLLKEEPGRRDLAEALAHTEEMRNERAANAPRNMADVLSEYIRLLLNYRQLLDLQALQRQVASKYGSK
jgi:tetratricopeptide (TPR) repeat protein